MDQLNQIIVVLGLLLGIFNFHKSVQFVVGLFFKPKTFQETDVRKRYGIIIPARNEEKVIGNLIESIHQQAYNQDLLEIFVVADNCNDKTAAIARQMGCHVYERFDDSKKRKGWALEYLFQQIEKDYGITSFDAYFVFDADNLLDVNYIYEMNKAFVENKNIVTSYRNSKNFETNWVSSAYAIHFYGRTVYNHRPRQLMGTGTHLAGTGFMISSHLLKDGWNYHSLTEDSELTMYMTAQNVKIGYCEAAIHYDEQPTSFKVGFRQRVRWTRGRLVVFVKTWKMLLKGIFKHKSFTNYDMLFYIMPYPLLTFFLNIAYATASLVIGIWVTQDFSWKAVLIGFGTYWGSSYVSNLARAALIVYRERKQIHCSFYKTLFYVLLSPWFSLISIFLMIVALFGDVEWVPVKHDDARKIQDINQKSMSLVPSVKQPLRLHVFLQGLGLIVILIAILAFAVIRHFELFSWTLSICFSYTLLPAVPLGLVFILMGLMIQKTIEKQEKFSQVK